MGQTMITACSDKRESVSASGPYPACLPGILRRLCWLVAWFALTACTVIDVSYGLRPQQIEVQSSHPILRWETFPPPRDEFAAAAVSKGTLQEVTYELLIWSTEEQGRPGLLVYSRKGLRASTHKVESSLAWSTTYLWTVRARFLLDGHVRFTEWARRLSAYEAKLGQSTTWTERSRAVPNEFCYRFTTPGEPWGQSSWWSF